MEHASAIYNATSRYNFILPLCTVLGRQRLYSHIYDKLPKMMVALFHYSLYHSWNFVVVISCWLYLFHTIRAIIFPTKNIGSENTICRDENNQYIICRIMLIMNHNNSLQILSRFKLVSNTVSSCGRRESKTFSPSAVTLIPLYL